MAYVSSHASTPFAGVAHALSTAFNAVFDFVASVSEADKRIRAVEALQAMSDEELMTRYRIERGQIVHFIFRDKMMF